MFMLRIHCTWTLGGKKEKKGWCSKTELEIWDFAYNTICMQRDMKISKIGVESVQCSLEVHILEWIKYSDFERVGNLN